MYKRRRRKKNNIILTLIVLVAVAGITVFAGKFILSSFGPKEENNNLIEKETKEHNTIFGEESNKGQSAQSSQTQTQGMKNEVQMKDQDQKNKQNQANLQEIKDQKQGDQTEGTEGTKGSKDAKAQKEEKESQQQNKAQEVKEQEKQTEQSKQDKPNQDQQAESPKQKGQSVQDFTLSASYDQEVANQFSFVKNDANSIYVMLNKKNALPDGYKPANLVVPKIDFPFSHDTPKKYMRAEAASALEKLFDAAKSQGHQLYGISGYRSYETQKGLYDMYVKKDGKEAADRYSSKPGYSEHQSGLVMDISSKAGGFDLQESFGDLEEGKWVAQNAHKYGFIVRYLKDKVHITGYDYEPWHLRYVGEEVASYMFENNLCYEEFYDRIGVQYNR